ncbi:fungal specific transcription factor domain protein [Zymoseptoria brevis]|uniref:Fungal specific transcription factor domain protein n=1 Tax=Zymoseptoria brevis TaxID=1047168 RepID=A0A0F4GSE5_9PEZI|nr:fungal specific transcription factor domain protein [Zymoseptoria brevis]
MESEAAAASVRTSTACDSCRIRKIKCDGQTPCRQCSSAERECQHLRRSKPREKRARVLLSTQYEQKIDRIEQHLSRLADAVATHGRSTVATPSTGGTPVTIDPPSVTTKRNGPAHEVSRTAITKGARTPVEPHSDFTHRLLGKVFRSDAGDISKDIITPAESAPCADEEAWEIADESTPSDGKYSLPPFTTVASLLVSERGKPTPLSSIWMNSIVAEDAFMGHCVAVYYSTAYTQYQLILVAGIMSWKFAYRAAANEFSDREALEESSQMCRAALETALSRLPLHMLPTLETLQALLVGATYAIEAAKPSRAWEMISKATEISQALEYHQMPPPDRSTGNLEHVTFGTFAMTYILDKGLSLRLGRCSNLRDHDISSFAHINQGLVSTRSTFQRYMTLSISVARLQGETYDQLYSASAVALQDNMRHSRAQELLASLWKLRDEMRSLRGILERDGDALNQEDSVMLMAEDVTILSLGTLILRTVRRSQNTVEATAYRCIDVAREALEEHRRCITAIELHNCGTLELYINWSLLYTPFAPAIVVFCNVLETGDVSDLANLEVFVANLRNRCDAHPSLQRLCVIFEPLLGIAQRFVQLQTNVNTNIAQIHNLQGEWTVQARTTNGDQSGGSNYVPPPGDTYMEGNPGQLFDASGDFTGDDPAFSVWLRDCQQTLHTLQQDDLFLTGTTLLQDF